MTRSAFFTRMSLTIALDGASPILDDPVERAHEPGRRGAIAPGALADDEIGEELRGVVVVAAREVGSARDRGRLLRRRLVHGLDAPVRVVPLVERREVEVVERGLV